MCECERERVRARQRKEGETEKSMLEIQWGVEDHIPAQLKETAHAGRGANKDERLKEVEDSREWEGPAHSHTSLRKQEEGGRREEWGSGGDNKNSSEAKTERR